MKNKRNIIAFILLLLPLLVAVGMSTWIILNESLLTPSYNPDPVIKKYFSGEESVIYDGNEQAPVSSVENLIEFGDLEFSYKPILDTTNNYISGKPKNAGVYDVKVSVKNLDNSSTNVKFTIEPKEISISIDGENSFIYNRTNQTPLLKVTDGLVANEICDLSTNITSVNVGNYTITKDNIILSNANYTLSDSTSFNYIINPKSITSTDITITGVPGFINLGTNLDKDSISVMDGDIQLAINTDYVITEENLTVLGTGYVNITGNGNYTGIIKKEIEVKEVLLALNLTCDQKQEKTYNKQGLSEVDLHINVTCDSQTITGYNLVIAKITDPNNNDYGTDITEIITVGTYYISLYVTKDNYEQSNTCQITYSINKREINIEWSNLEFTYDGNTKVPTATATNLCTGDDCTITVTGGQINANVNSEIYTATASALSNINYKLPSNNTRTFLINPKVVTLDKTIITYSYNKSKRTYEAICGEIINKIKLANESLPYSLAIYGMCDGTFAYGDISFINDMKLEGYDLNNYKINGVKITGDSNDNLVGSTYIVAVKIANTNFIYKNNAEYECLTFKYQTAKISSTYYTIEDALSYSGDITFAGDSSNATSFVYTAFCNLKNNIYNTNSFTISNRKVLIPFKDGQTFSSMYEKHEASSPTEKKVYASLYVPNGISLTFKDNSNLILGSIISGSGKCGNVGVLLNCGTINIESGCNVYSYGFIKGNGVLNLNSGSSATDVMTFNDWPSTSNAMSIVQDKAFPFLSWNMHNISCNTYIYTGSTYKAFTSIYGSSFLVGYREVTLDVIYNTYTSNSCLFMPSQSSKSTDYILKKGQTSADTYIFDITTSNQDAGQKDIVEVSGDYYDGQLRVAISGYSFNSSTEIALPLSYFDLIVKSNSNLTFSKSSYIFMCGTKMVIEENANVTINGCYIAFDKIDDTTNKPIIGDYFNTYLINRKSSEVINNGTIKGTGSIGGIVNTEAINSSISISNYAINSIKIKNSGNGVKNVSNYELYGTFVGNEIKSFNEVISTLNVKSFKSSYDNYYYWNSENDVTIFTLNFYDGNNLLESLTIQVVGSTTYKILGSEYLATKQHYKFIEWLLADGRKAKDYILEENAINLYASWEEKKYSIVYHFGCGYKDDGTPNYIDPNEISYVDKLETFTISNFINNVLNISTQVSYNNMVFDGWYVGLDKTINKKFSSITLEQFENYLGQNLSSDLMLYGEFIESPANIRFRTDYSDVATPISGTIMSPKGLQQSITLTDLDELSYQNTNNNNKFEYYFVGWYINDSDIVYNPNETITIDIDGDIEFIAKWEKKITISFGEAPLGYTYTDSSNIYLTPHSDFNLVGLGDVNNIQTSDKAQLTKVTLKHYVISTDPLNQYPIAATITDITESFTVTPIVQSDIYYRITYKGDVEHILEKPATIPYDNIDYISEKVQLVFKVSGKEGGLFGWGKKRTTITISGGCSVSAHGAYSDDPSIIDFGEKTLTGEITVTAKYG